MRRSTMAMLALVLLGSLGGTAALAEDPPDRRPEVGHAPPEVKGALGAWPNAPVARAGAKGPLWDPDARGEIDFERLKGKVVIIEFWATWCPPCRESIPHLNELQEEYRDDVVVLGLTAVDEHQTEAQVRAFVKQHIRYPVGILPDGKVLERYGVEGIPHALVVGKDGKIKWKGHPAGRELTQAVHDAVGPRARPPAEAPTSRPSRR